MSKHTITLENLATWMTQQAMTYASDTENRKRLSVTLGKPWFEVTANDVAIYAGADIEKAVEAYNSI